MKYRIDPLRYQKYRKARVYNQTVRCGICNRLFISLPNYNFNTLLYTVRAVEMPDPRDRFGFPCFPLLDIFCSKKCATMFIIGRMG